MRIAVYSICRERLQCTQTCFQSLRENAAHPFDHFVVDNGSEDGTHRWLIDNHDLFTRVILNSEDRGISAASNQALEAIFGYRGTYDLIVKFDSDCLAKTPRILARMAEIYGRLEKARLGIGPAYILSPRVEGMVGQPARTRETWVDTDKPALIGLTTIVGGLFHVVPARVYGMYRYPEDLANGGQDGHFCRWVRQHGGEVGYIEELLVERCEMVPR